MAGYRKQILQAYALGSDPLVDVFPTPIVASRVPTSADLGTPGQVWIYSAGHDIYMLSDITAGVAYWEPLSASGGAAPISKYVVDPDGTADYTTVQAAITAANASATTEALIYVRPGTYTEDLTLYDGIIIQGSGIQTIITGVHTPPASGGVYFFDLYMTSATDIITSAAAGTTRLDFFNVTFNCTNGYIVDCASWTGSIGLYACIDASTANGIVNVATSTVAIRDSNLGAGANALGIAGGTLAVMNSRISCPVSPTGASAVSFTQGCYIGATVTTAGSTALAVYDSAFSTGASAALSHGSSGAVTLSNCTLTSSANPCITGAGAGTLTLTDVNFLSNAALAATLTRAFVAETKSSKVTCGDSVYRVNDFSDDGNVISVYCTDATATGANYNKAIRGDMTVSSGDGTDSPQAIRGNMVTSSGAHHEEAYGGYFWAQQDDGSQIDSNLIGLVSAAYSLETDAADLPQQWAYGVQGILFGSDTAAAYAAGLQAGVASYVTYNTSLNAVGHGFLASRNGGGAGGTANAAYKVEAGSAIISDWNYGVDLYNGATGLAYATADIRLWNQTTILSAATDVTTTYPDTVEALFVMTDSENFQVANTVDGTFAGLVEAVEGVLTVAASASILQATGVMGYLTQADGSAITSTASGVEGWLNLLETDIADLPTVYAFGVKGYLDAADTTGVPGGLVAGVGSVVEYNTPFDSKAYGMVVTRLDAGTGAGTAGAAAYKVSIGTRAAGEIVDWDYGLDLLTGGAGAGIYYTTADIRYTNGSTVAGGAAGLTISIIGNYTLDGEAATVWSIGASTVAGTMDIGGTGQTGALTIGPSTAAMTLNLANANGAKTINMGNGVDGNTISIGNGINTSAQTINIASGAAAANSTVNIFGGVATAGTQTLNLATGASATAVNIGNATGATAVAITSGTGNIALASTGTGDITIDSDDTVLIDADGVIEINSSAGVIGIGNDADAQNINIGTGAAARVITIGNVTDAAQVVLNSGTGGIQMTSTGAGDITIDSDDTLLLDADGVIEINSSAGVIGIGNDADAQNINIGTGAAARVITIGNVTDASQVVLNSGTGGIQLASTGAGDITIDSDDTFLLDADGVIEINSSGGTISIGNDADAQNIDIGTGAAARTITIGNATGATDVNINTGGGAQTVDISGAVDATLDVRARQLVADGDNAGTASCNTFTNVSSGVSTGNGTVKMNSANPADSSGWIKIYVGTDARYIPYWTTNAP